MSSASLPIFPIAYFPPVPWFAAAAQHERIGVEVCQHFRKQQLTNRMHIKITNRILPLSIPVERRGTTSPIREKKISYAEDWRGHHWKSLIASYRNSPYFMYYEAELYELYQRKPVFLMDWLRACLEWSIKQLRLDLEVEETTSFKQVIEKDFRQTFDPGLKHLPESFEIRSYPQVFEGFTPGLSILDLLNNEGPQSTALLKASWTRI